MAVDMAKLLAGAKVLKDVSQEADRHLNSHVDRTEKIKQGEFDRKRDTVRTTADIVGQAIDMVVKVKNSMDEGIDNKNKIKNEHEVKLNEIQSELEKAKIFAENERKKIANEHEQIVNEHEQAMADKKIIYDNIQRFWDLLEKMKQSGELDAQTFLSAVKDIQKLLPNTQTQSYSRQIVTEEDE